MSLSLLQKPKYDYVFIDTSALIAALNLKTRKKEDPAIAESYRKLFSELFPAWKLIGIINPMVLYETINVLQSICLTEHVNIPLKDVQRIKYEMAKRKKFYRPQWEKAHEEATNLFEKVIIFLEEAENIICHDMPGDDAHYSDCKKILPELKSFGPDAPTPADQFHVHFMRKNGLSCIIAQDKHFDSIPGIVLHTYHP